MSNIPASSMPFNDSATDGASVTAAIWNQAMQTLVMAINDNYTRILNMTNAQSTILVASGTTYPLTPSNGQLFYRTDLAQTKIYNGTTWVDAESTVNAANNLIFNSINYPPATAATANTVALRDSVGGLTIAALTASTASFSGTSSHTGLATFNGGATVASSQAFTNNGSYAGTAPLLTSLTAGANIAVTNPAGGTGAATVALSGVVPVANGGTGSSTQNFVDLTTTQTIGGSKTLTGTTAIGNSVASAVALNLLPSGLAPLAGSFTWGDGTGWLTKFTTRAATPIDVLILKDTGDVTVAGALTINGSGGSFANSKAANGYQKLPGGLILQWGTASIPSGTAITFPIAFPTLCASVTVNTALGTMVSTGTGSISVNGFTMYHGNGATATTIYWMAIGY